MLIPSTITGTAAGVPFIAVPPTTSPHETAPIVIAWHLLDAPRTPAAFAAAVPLAGLDAWRVYLTLPLCGARMPAGGFDEITRLGMEDAVKHLYEPIIVGAADEFPAVLSDLRQQLSAHSSALGLLGGSAGSAVAQLVLAESGLSIGATVLVSPMPQLRPVISLMSTWFGVFYTWSDTSDGIASRLDFAARADEIATRQHESPILMILGDADDETLISSTRDEHAALLGLYANPDRIPLVMIAGMPHALAEGDGIEPAPQNADAAEVDQLAAEWFRQHLMAE